MINIKKISIVALILLIVGVVGSIFTINSVGESEIKTEEIEISNEDFMHIDIKSENAGIEILPTSDRTTTIEFTGNRVNDEQYNVNADIEEDTLFITVKEKRFKLFNFDFSFSAPSLKVYLPEKMYETVQVDSDNGRIKAGELQSEDIKVETNNGKIELKNVKSSAVIAEANNGKIFLDNVEGELSSRTNNGEISLITEHLDRPIEFETDNGRIMIQTENEPTNAIFDVKVDNGRVTVFGNSNWNTVIGNGDNEIKLTTNNGSITIEK